MSGQRPTHLSQGNRLPDQPGARAGSTDLRPASVSVPRPIDHPAQRSTRDDPPLVNRSRYSLMTKLTTTGIGADIEVPQMPCMHSGADTDCVSPISPGMASQPGVGGAVTAFARNTFIHFHLVR